MQKIFGIEKYEFYISELSTSIIYNEEIVKNKIIAQLVKSDFLVIDSKSINLNITVKDFLKSFKFNMKLIPYYNIENMLNLNHLDLSFKK